MIDLAIGTRFYYNGKLYKVVEIEHEYERCSECDIFHYECSVMDCASELRQDGKEVCFKLIEE